MTNYYIEPGKYAEQNAEPKLEAISKYFGLTHIVQYSYSFWRGPKAPALIANFSNLNDVEVIVIKSWDFL